MVIHKSFNKAISVKNKIYAHSEYGKLIKKSLLKCNLAVTEKMHIPYCNITIFSAYFGPKINVKNNKNMI